MWETDEASLLVYGTEKGNCAIIALKMSTPIQHPEFFSIQKNYAVCRPVGELSLDEAVRLIDDSLRFCKENDIIRLLANVTEAGPFPSPSVTDRFWFITKWAESARGLVMLSIVAPEDIIHPEKIGKLFASNRGLQGDIFTNEAEAIEWLCSRG